MHIILTTFEMVKIEKSEYLLVLNDEELTVHLPLPHT